MVVTQQNFLDFLGSAGTRFTIPAYQRLYSWSTVQCEELWLDILRAGRADRNHFLGTVLYSREGAGAVANADSGDGAAAGTHGAHDTTTGAATGNGVERLSVIDGQQRLTSVSLVLLALARYLDAHPSETAGSPSGEAIRKRYLVIDAGGGNAIARFTPSLHDQNPYRAAIDGKPGDPQSAVTKNLAFFENKLAEGPFDPQTLMRGLGRLGVIVVEVEDPEAAQAIFEGINSKGMPLNVADMVRNYLLLAETHDEQARLYREYWKPSQDMFSPDPGSLKLNTAIKSWISIRLKGARILSSEQVYASFKRYVEDVYRGAKEPILRELRGFCLMWAENYRYHGVKKYKSGSDWAEIGAPTLTAGYELKKADNEEYAQRVREQMKNADLRW